MRENVSPRHDKGQKLTGRASCPAASQCQGPHEHQTARLGLSPHNLKPCSCRAVPVSRQTGWRSSLAMKEKVPSVSGPEGKTGRTMARSSQTPASSECLLTGVRTREATHVQVDPHTGTQERDSCTCVHSNVAARQRSVMRTRTCSPADVNCCSLGQSLARRRMLSG